MKILHCGDIHFRNDLISEISKCTDFIVEKASREKVNLSIIAGDLFDERQTYDSPAYQHAVGFIKNMADVSPVYILKGTNSHDGNSLKFLEAIETRYKVYVAEEIEHTMFLNNFVNTDYEKLLSGIRHGAYSGAIIFSLPPISKSGLLSYSGNGSNIEESRNETIDLLRDVLKMWGAISEEARLAGIPTILAGHLSVTGATLSTGQQMLGREIELGVGDLRMAGADLVCLGHIHKVQSWGEIFYSGSVTRLNFGEEEKKGFWIHEITDGKLSSSRFIETPARVMVTLDYEGLPEVENLQIPENSFVRIRYRIAEEDIHNIDEVALKERALRTASEVKIEKTVVPKQRVRAEGISTLTSIEEKLRKWGATTGTEITESILRKLSLLEMESEEIQSDKFKNLMEVNA